MELLTLNTSFAVFKWIEESYEQVDENCKVEGDVSPEWHVATEPWQIWIGWKYKHGHCTGKDKVIKKYTFVKFDVKSVMNKKNDHYIYINNRICAYKLEKLLIYQCSHPDWMKLAYKVLD